MLESTTSAPPGDGQEEPRVEIQVEQPVIEIVDVADSTQPGDQANEFAARPSGGPTPSVVTVSSHEEPRETAEVEGQVTLAAAEDGATPLESEKIPKDHETPSGTDLPVIRQSPRSVEPPSRPRLKSMVVQGCSGS